MESYRRCFLSKVYFTQNNGFEIRPWSLVCIWKKESVSCPVVYNSLQPMDCSPPGSSVHGILQAKILEWVAIPFSRGSSQPRDQIQISCIAGEFFIIWTTKQKQNLSRSKTSSGALIQIVSTQSNLTQVSRSIIGRPGLAPLTVMSSEITQH